MLDNYYRLHENYSKCITDLEMSFLISHVFSHIYYKNYYLVSNL